jgi:D-3-phosphoglycerate dehydrogenase / 2-oxoglutarate reductase
VKILIADKLSDRTADDLRKLGAELDIRPDLTAELLPSAVGDSQVLVVRSTKVTSETIDAGQKLSLIVRAGAGVNTIDVEAASRRGIYVTNCPGKNSAAVAELAIGLLIAADRRIVDATDDLRSGKWRKKEYGKARGLQGRRLGILGLGTIGLGVAQRAQGLGMQVAAWSRSLTPERAEELGLEYCSSPLELAGRCDAISIHLAATSDTKGIINRDFLNAMPEGAVFVNTSRGEVVDQDALLESVKQGKLRVGLDVYQDEPRQGEAPFNDVELAQLVTATPHIGASTDQAAEAIADEVVRIVRSFIETGKPVNTVNMCARSPATHSLVIRHYNRVGVLAGVLDLLRREEINVEEMENTIFEDAQAACCTLQLDSSPSESTLTALQESDSILQVMLGSR